MPALFKKILQIGNVTEPLSPVDQETFELVRTVGEQTRRLLGRALAIREIDAGSCNGCEIEISGLTSPVYDSERFGIHFVASPRHADLLLVTGPVTRNMQMALIKTYEATPAPKLVVAAGDCAKTCGVFRGSYAVAGSVDQFIPVDVYVPGCPPEPADLLRGILAALGRLAPDGRVLQNSTPPPAPPLEGEGRKKRWGIFAPLGQKFPKPLVQSDTLSDQKTEASND